MRKGIVALVFLFLAFSGILWYTKHFFIKNFRYYCNNINNIKEPEKIIELLNKRLILKLKQSNSAIIYISEDELNAILQKLNSEGTTPYRGCFKIKDDVVQLFWFNRFLWGKLQFKFKDTEPYFFVSKISVYGITLPVCCREKINRQLLTEYLDYFEHVDITSFKIVEMKLSKDKIKIIVERKSGQF